MCVRNPCAPIKTCPWQSALSSDACVFSYVFIIQSVLQADSNRAHKGWSSLRKEALKAERGTLHRLVCLSTSDCWALILCALYSCVSPVWMNVNGIIPQASALSFPPTSHWQARFWSSPYVELISNLLNHDDSINQRMSFFFFFLFFFCARCVAIFSFHQGMTSTLGGHRKGDKVWLFVQVSRKLLCYS